MIYKHTHWSLHCITSVGESLIWDPVAYYVIAERLGEDGTEIGLI